MNCYFTFQGWENKKAHPHWDEPTSARGTTRIPSTAGHSQFTIMNFVRITVTTPAHLLSIWICSVRDSGRIFDYLCCPGSHHLRVAFNQQ